MPAVYLTFFLLLSASLLRDACCLPFPESNPIGELTSKEFRGFIPKTTHMRLPRAEGEGQSGGSGIGDMINTAIKDGIAASSAVDSPTMFIGGFSVMMQPMPNGTEFAGQLMQMAPHYMNLIPGAGGK